MKINGNNTQNGTLNISIRTIIWKRIDVVFFIQKSLFQTVSKISTPAVLSMQHTTEISGWNMKVSEKSHGCMSLFCSERYPLGGAYLSLGSCSGTYRLSDGGLYIDVWSGPDRR